MAIEEFDVFVIGSGIAGQTVAKACAKNGYKVAIADRREYGGTCANRGCDPKKVLLGFTEILQKADQLSGKGISSLPKTDWKKIQSFKSSFTDPVPASTEDKLTELGIKLYHQAPKFLDENTLSVEGKTVKFKKAVIASGLTPRNLDIKGKEHALISDDFLNLEELPDSMVFIGAGYIGMEFAHIAARFGVEVTMIQSGDRPLKNFDPDLVSKLVDVTEDLGIKMIFNARVTEIEDLRKNKRVHYEVGESKKQLKAELVFNTTGRVPSIEGLDLEKGNIAYSDRGITVNEFLQNTTNKNVYACGDVSDNAVPLTPFSGREGEIVAHNMESGNTLKANFPDFPSVTFTIPNLAQIGLSEEEAKKKFKNIKINCRDASSFFNAKRIDDPIYAYKTIVNEDNDQILGVHLIGAEAAEVINLFAIAIAKKLTVSELKKIVFAYPTWGGDIPYMF